MSVIRAAAAAALLLGSALTADAQSSSNQTSTSTTSAAATQERQSSDGKSGSTAATRAKRQPTKGQLAAQERQRSCAAEWRTAKAAGTQAGQTWPKFWSQCNTRLKSQGT